ncbi:MAG: transporter [Nitrospiraceae bacterium]|nr:transporter [Nitrospiraceae bacterium]
MKERIVRLHLHICGLVVLGLLASSPSFAAIPLITDDTGTQGKGKFQLELATEFGHDKDETITNKNSDFSATLTYGITDSVDVVLFVPYGSWRSDDSGSATRESGFSDLAIETKWRFYEKEGVSLALKPGFTVPTGDAEKDLGNGRMTYYLYFIASKEMNPWAFHLNLAYIRNNNTGNDRKDIWHASLASTVGVMKNLKLVGDIGLETNPESASSTPPAYVLGGAIYSASENFDIGLGLKAGLTNPETDVAVRGGIAYRF